ncbi:cytidine deaminase [Thermovibrio ammonificans]
MKSVELLKVAREHLENCYCPYSGVQVVAVLFGPEGPVVGVNVENASYGLTVCAERSAVFSAVSRGLRDFEGIFIYSPQVMPYPCGACRQVLSEFFPEDFQVVVTNGKEEEKFTLGELLPFNFKL